MAITDGLVSFWKMEEASGIRYDSYGANHLTDNNTVTSAPGIVGNAAEFTAANAEFLSIATNPSLQVADTDFTFIAWVYLSTLGATGNAQGTILAEDDATNRSFHIYYPLNTSPSPNTFAWRVFKAGGSVIVEGTSFGAATANTWIQVIAQYTASTQTAALQINNGAIDSLALGGAHVLSVGDFTIGERALVASEMYWDGRIDQVGFWSRLLTSDEKTSLYNNGDPFGILPPAMARRVYYV